MDLCKTMKSENMGFANWPNYNTRKYRETNNVDGVEQQKSD